MSDTKNPPDDSQWLSVKDSLKSSIGDINYNSWIRPIEFDRFQDEMIYLSAPSQFLCDWVKQNYLRQIIQSWQSLDKNIKTISIDVGIPKSTDTSEKKTTSDSVTKSINDVAKKALLDLDPKYTFENFVVGKPNELAYAAAKRVSENPEVSFNPLFLYGGVGLGKTHLMHAIAWDIKNNQPDRKVIYLSAEKFMYQFVRALRTKDTMAFKQAFRSVDVLMIDDVQFIGGRDATQEEFFHTFNALVDQKRQIIISADKSPSDLEGLEERLKSRLGWGLVADIHPTSYELRLGILQSKCESMGVHVNTSILEFLAHKISSNVRELEGSLNRITAFANLIDRPIDMDLVQDVLKDLIRSNNRTVDIESIQKKVAEHYNIKLSDMHSTKRSRIVARPRQIAMFLCKSLTDQSLPEIGRKFGGRDHTTVMHAIKTIENMRLRDFALNEDITLLSKALENIKLD